MPTSAPCWGLGYSGPQGRLRRVVQEMWQRWCAGHIEECLRNRPLVVELLEACGPEFALEAEVLRLVPFVTRQFTGSTYNPVQINFPTPIRCVPTGLAFIRNARRLFWFPPDVLIGECIFIPRHDGTVNLWEYHRWIEDGFTATHRSQLDTALWDHGFLDLFDTTASPK